MMLGFCAVLSFGACFSCLQLPKARSNMVHKANDEIGLKEFMDGCLIGFLALLFLTEIFPFQFEQTIYFIIGIGINHLEPFICYKYIESFSETQNIPSSIDY